MNHLEKDKEKSGFLLVYKPSGPTSHDIINKLRKIMGIRKIGHAGTLDPFASGLLIVAVGREATRGISRFVKLDKEYIATLFLGAVSDTYDRTGKVVAVSAARDLVQDTSKIEDVCKNFIGLQQQVPPMYSAKKVGGKKLYELARQGIEIERAPARVEIHSINLLDYSHPYLMLKINCSSGTYIRSLAHDIGQALGAGAYLAQLKRTKIGPYSSESAIILEDCGRDQLFDQLVPGHYFLTNNTATPSS